MCRASQQVRQQDRQKYIGRAGGLAVAASPPVLLVLLAGCGAPTDNPDLSVREPSLVRGALVCDLPVIRAPAAKPLDAWPFWRHADPWPKDLGAHDRATEPRVLVPLSET